MIMTEKERQRIFSIVNAVILKGKRYDRSGDDLVIDVGYTIVEVLENEVSKNKLYEAILKTLIERDYVYSYINNYWSLYTIAKVITDRIMPSDNDYEKAGE